MNSKIRNMSILMVVMLCLSVVTSQAFAQKSDPPPQLDYNTTTVIQDSDEENREGATVGENGYGVFNPGAIARVGITPVEKGLQTAALLTIYRSGSTDAWLDYAQCGTLPCWYHYGSHQSGSDLNETDIWVDGFLKVTTDAGWRTSCSQHTSGFGANCETSFSHLLPRTIYGQSNHFMHSSGYVDSSFTTADSA
jgi:hypothetical protein